MSAGVQPKLVASGFAFPEGPAFDKDGNLFFVNCNNGAITKVTPDGQVSEFVNTGGVPVAVAFGADGCLYCTEAKHKCLLRITSDGQISTFVDNCEGKPFNGTNDLCFHPNGSLYFTDPAGCNWVNRIGGIYYATPDGKVHPFAYGFLFPNGIAVSSDGRYLYVAETYPNVILRWELNSDGSAGKGDLFAKLEGGVGPDGMCFDSEGNLYVAHYGSGSVDVISPEGKVVAQLPAGGKNPTNCTFHPNGDLLYVTETETDSVYTLAVGKRGAKVSRNQSMWL